jgi:aryl-alcohol dehydrogenase-like predicted oxidoreductase
MFTFATPAGTRRYVERLGRDLARACAPEHFRELPTAHGLLHLSSIGIGSYGGPLTDAADSEYADAVRSSIRQGMNIVDCSINYRHQRSERALGTGLRRLFEAGEASRDEVFVMSKAGYLSFDGGMPAGSDEYIRKTYLETGLVPPAEFVARRHCIAPSFLEDQLARSLANFGLESLDCYYLHNIEEQLEETTPEEFERRVTAAFAFLEAAVARGTIGCYGVATWNGLRVPQESPAHLSLERLEALALAAGGKEHHFRVVQLPYNLGMLEALGTPSQGLQGGRVPLLEAAAHFGLMVVTSVPLLQTQVIAHVPAAFAPQMPGLTTQAQRAIQFVRSTPGVFAPLVGMRRMVHVHENGALAHVPPLTPAEFYRILGK